MRTFAIGDVHGRRAQLRRLIEMLPRDPQADTLVLLGDLIDRGEDAPGVVEDAMELQRGEAGGRVVVLRGNHEQMLLDFIDGTGNVWLHEHVGSEDTFRQYAGRDLFAALDDGEEETRREIARAVPPAHVEFFRQMPFYYEDDYAIYVHAGLEGGRHPRETDPHRLLWSRDADFFKHYQGKPCVFGHTPTPFLPLLGRIGRHGVYISHSAVGIDTGYNHDSPLTCLALPDFTLYQTYWDGRSETHHITTFIPEQLRALRDESFAESETL